MDFRLKVYKADKRTKTGERLVNTYDYRDTNLGWMKAEISDLKNKLYPENAGWRLEFYESTTTVKNLMTGADVVVDVDTPWSCRPDSESYWSS